jgi:DNA-binding transcriptional ArsR family regulator
MGERTTASTRASRRAPSAGLEATARFFRVLGDPTRLRLLEALLERERSVGELVRLLGAPQGRVSNHLACLKWCRVVEAERRGRRVIYRVTDPRVRELLERAAPLVEANRRHLESCERIGPSWV